MRDSGASLFGPASCWRKSYTRHLAIPCRRWRTAVAARMGHLAKHLLVCKLSRETGVDSMARSFSPWSHLVSMLFAQLTHAIGLNDVCDALRLHSGPLSSLGSRQQVCGNLL